MFKQTNIGVKTGKNKLSYRGYQEMKNLCTGLLLVGSLLISGCSSKAQIVTYSAPEINTKNQTISILPFGYDRLGVKSALEYDMNNTYINGTKYFSLTNNPSLANIVISGTVSDLNQSFYEYQSNMTEEVCYKDEYRDRGGYNYNNNYSNHGYNSNNYNSNYRNGNYREDRVTCYKKPIRCLQTTYSATLYVDIQQGGYLKKESFSASEMIDTCSNYSNDYIATIRNSLAGQLANMLKPVRNVYYIEYKKELYGKYSSQVTNLQEDFISLTKDSDLNRALFVNNQIKDLTGNIDFVPFYNEGLILESKNQLKEAKDSYLKALNLESSPSDRALINSCLNRISDSIAKKGSF